MPVGIIRTAWAGTSGGAGLTQFAFKEADGTFITPTSAQTLVDATRTFWDAIKANLPDEVVLTVSPVIDFYNEASGELFSSMNVATSPTAVQGTSAAVFSMASGMKINLNTGTIRNGRRVRGGIFIVPAASTVYGSTGLISSTVRTATNTAANALRTTMATQNLHWHVYSRPVTENLEATPPIEGRDGAVSLITGCETNEKVAILRGRRD